MLQKISRHRTALMGCAIIWIFLYHSKITIPYIDNLFVIGYGGVDIFLFLSGYGLFFSFSNNQNIVNFYKKRFLRIFPTYILIVFLSMICWGTFNASIYGIYITTIGYWFHLPYFEWYIPSLVVFYLIFPLAFKVIQKNIVLFILISLLITLICMGIRIGTHADPRLMLFISRIPIFCLGVVAGKWAFEKRPFSKNLERWAYLISIIGLVILIAIRVYLSSVLRWNYGLSWFPFILITPGICLGIASLLDRIQLRVISKLLIFFGTISLELYLLHLTFFERAFDLSVRFHMPREMVLFKGLLVIISLSFILNEGLRFLVKKLKSN